MRVPCRRCGVRINVWRTVTHRNSHCPNCGHSLLSKHHHEQPSQQASSDVIDEKLFEIPSKAPQHEVTRRVPDAPRENIIDPELFEC